MTTLWEVWSRNAEAEPGATSIVHWDLDAAARRWTRRELMDAAEAVARRLHAEGVRKGHVCALVCRHHPDFYAVYLGIVRTGALPAVLAYPNPRIHPDKFRQGLEGMARRSGLDWVLTERALDPIVRPLALGREKTVRGIIFPLEDGPRSDPDPVAASGPEPCLLQHSSGTTGLQKGVVLSHDAVIEHVRTYGEAIGLGREDKVVSWLPLYHDMGLIAAFHLPLVHGIPTVQLDPFQWVSAPALFLDAVSKERGTLAWLPNFAYNLMADRVHDEEIEGVGLESLRLLVNCSEPVRASSHERFLARFESRGLRREALGASYAMAEATFAVTQTTVGRAAPVVAVDREELARGVARLVPPGPEARACVSSGRVLPGLSVRVLGADDRELPDGHTGELAIRSPTLFAGYRNDAERTAEVLHHGEYRSGDEGFRLDGELFVVGRRKDILIVAGKNVYPEDVEDAVSAVPGLLKGRVVAYGREDETSGTELVCVVAERDPDVDGPRAESDLRRAVVEAGASVGVAISRVDFVPPRWLIKSSSGKPSRRANRERAIAELERDR